ncbi:MAG: polysaccharide biosynthesis protein [Eubacterium sp.]|nr:polysaccharide biosynthesis protein [Eubacterium sp.]
MENKITAVEEISGENKFVTYLKLGIIAIIDLSLLFVCNMLICSFTEGQITGSSYAKYLYDYRHLLIVSAIGIAANLLFGLYKSVWRYAGTDEGIRSIGSAFVQGTCLFFIDRFLFKKVFFDGTGGLGWYAYILFFLFLCLALVLPRFGFRIMKKFSLTALRINSKQERVMIVGAGFMGNFVIDALGANNFRDGMPVIAVDDNKAKHGKKLNGVKVAGTCAQIPELKEKYDIDQIIICIPSASEARQREVINIAMQTGAKVRISPSVEEMFDKTVKKRVRNVDISDLLPRQEVTLDKKICKYLVGKTVLVTGGGGSIGSEICNQVARYNPNSIIIFDIYENNAFELENDLNDKYNGELDVYVRIGSVRDENRLREVFEEFRPDVVFHAAAHKHVPLMEDSPCEAVKNNVFGTLNVAKICDEFGVKKMVVLSTDKAVNPTNVMGCTKRICELIVQYMNTKAQTTKYTAVRFGNVLGSHGSVIPIFKKQIEKGGPVKVTHKDITRYFMTIPEAAQLVCQAGGISKGGEVFVLDMGEPVKIIDLARNLIRLSGYTEDEIGIEITGLRPGEKLYEELAVESEIETREKTQNEKIYVNQLIEIDDKMFSDMMSDLETIDNDNVREILSKHITTYHPKTENQ